LSHAETTLAFETPSGDETLTTNRWTGPMDAALSIQTR